MPLNNPFTSVHKWLYLPDGWNAAWEAAKAASGATPAWMLGVGDSWMHGAYATDWLTSSFWGQLRTWLLGSYGLYGDFYPVSESLFAAADYDGTPPWTVNDAAHLAGGVLSIAGYTRGLAWTGAVANPMATFVTPYACTAFDIIHQSPYAAVGSTFTYTIDGGGPQTVTLPAASNANLLRTSVTGLADTTHTIVITGQSADYAAYIYGIATYGDPATGLGFAKCAMQGEQAVNYIDRAGVQPRDRYYVFQGKTATGVANYGFPSGPALALIALGLNDCQNLFAPHIFEVALVRIVGALRRAYANCSIVMLAVNNPDGISSDVTSNTLVNAPSWPYYVDTMHAVARAHNCAFVNLHAKWGETGVASGFQTASQTHPQQAGHDDIAALLKEIV